ncbi:MAG: GNAT family N-acetyltransferase [Gammaproteobacteria bacterium]|nr:GNAT family N-acetyltransferase [Gammaproteobacteria bacterium]
MSLTHAAPQFTVRPFERGDVTDVLSLMRELAVYERYINQFRVTESDIIENGLSDSPHFGVFVAEMDGYIVGIAVHYEVPWTYDLKPVLVLKELFVSKNARALGAGRALLAQIEKHALEINASRTVWTVLKDNDAAKQFYMKAGGQKDVVWELWGLDHSKK